MLRMKTVVPAEDLQPGKKVVTTTTREILPADSEKKSAFVEFWPYVEALKPEEWQKHIVYIYRMDPRTVTSYGDGISAIDKITGVIDVRPGVQVPFTDREEVELAIREKFGGKAFRLILKKGSERISETRCTNDYPPRYPSPTDTSNPGVTPLMSDANATADVAKTAMHALSGQERAATETAIRALDGAATVITRLAAGNAAAQPSETDQLMRQAMAALLTKALNPPDPFETLSRLVPLLQGLTGGGGGGSNPPAVTRLIDTAIERLVNPATAGPVSTAAGELVRQLPSVAGYVTQAIREWRAGVEAQERTAAIMTGAPARAPQPTAGGAAVNPTILQPQVLQAPPPGAAAMPGLPSLEFVESKIIEILNEGRPAEDAADDTLAFLDRLDPQLIKILKEQGEPGLLKLFQRPTLMPAMQNMPRLVEFIRALLKLAGGSEAQPPAGSVPPAA